ncbi:phosphatidylinositol-4-phosphate 5-kinase-like [Novymonas esmeraldas]|uniref:Phosphatidylinositol-4-phosphate 5-kinase-like n=1 Tax=Novymonas esmeraldas TaxID=1808958 RepID=A0AAW0EKR6_9TRYP
MEPQQHEEQQLRQLRHENHLLRLQLLKLRDQQQELLHNGSASPASADGAATRTSGEPSASETLQAQTFSDAADQEASAMRLRMLQRREERQLRATIVRTLMDDIKQLHGELAQQQQQQQTMEVVRSDTVQTRFPASPQKPTTVPVRSSSVQHAYDEMVQRQLLLANAPSTTSLLTPTPPLIAATSTAEPVRGSARATIDDSSAEALLQRFQDRKAQRRLRLEQMMGSGQDTAAAATTPLGGAPSVDSGMFSCNGSRVSEASSGSGPGSSPQRQSRLAADGDAVATAATPSAGAIKNPNQIGRIVSDAVKNNSWYLCKVLETALLDTILARPVNEAAASVPRSSTLPEKQSSAGPHASGILFGGNMSSASSSSSSDSAASLYGTRSDGRATVTAVSGTTTPSTRTASTTPQPQSTAASPTSVTVPQLLYREGVSDTALRRAIEESLFLPFRCIQDAPRRLTSSQAAEEGLPVFESENRDAELRRCFADGAAGKEGNSARREDDVGSVAPGNDEDEAPEKEADMLGASDENLDPFARLLLARLSATLPANTAKADKKGKPSVPHGSGGAGSKDASKQSVATSLGGPPKSSPATGPRAGVADIVAAAGGDRRVHLPKKHFSRLDEVQVEMHAPVIFNQIRGFLRMDVDRFRRSFAPTSTSVTNAAADGKDVVDSERRRAAQTQQRRLRIGTMAGADEATAWRISVSPGKSGTTLLYFGDFVMKTVRPSELEFLLRKFLPAYVRYCERNPHTLLPRFYALVTLRWWKAGVVQHFVLMQNVFATPYYIHRIYDVKGSTVNRTALQPGKPPPRTAFGALLLKDNDLPAQLVICGTYQRAIMLAQFRSDVGFLRQLNVVDYSCMIGVRSRLFSREEGPSKTILLLRRQHHDPLGRGDEATAAGQGHHGRERSEVLYVTGETAAADGPSIGVGAVERMLPPPQSSADDDVYVCIHGCDGGLLSLPIYAPGDDTTAREDVYYLGIIDVLQTYNSAKKLESFAKGFVNDRSAISVIPPDKYAERLYKVLERITV